MQHIHVINSGAHQNNSYGRDQNINNHFYTTNANPAYERLVSAIAGIGGSHRAEQQFERGCCLSETRVEPIKAIRDWRSNKQQKQPICWLSGAAGVGKSAIAMTVARDCEKEGVLGSSFFFFRSDPKRNNPSTFIPAIAHDLASTAPLIQKHIEQRISKDPGILEATLEDKFHGLIVEPVLAWSKQRDLPGSPDLSSIVVLDGLDECGDEEAQSRILSIIQSAYQQAPDFPLRFLICSRPESWIQEAFADDPLFELSKTIVLDNSPAVRKDIRRYLIHHFREIATSRKYRQVQFPSPWPSEEDLEILVERSCGQFVYASTIIKFIQLAFKHPTEQLHIIIENAPARRSGTSPYPQLDALYDLVLRANPDFEELLPILAAILVLPDGVKSPACIELVFGLPAGQVALALRAMYSVLNIGKWGSKIKLHHTSFQDYLTDQARSGHFHIDIPTWTNDIAQRWLQNLSTNKVRTYSFDQLYGKETKPFFTSWIIFCSRLNFEPSRELLGGLWNVDLAFPRFVNKEDRWKYLMGSLVSWVNTYHKYRISETEDDPKDDLDFVACLKHKLQVASGPFHLEWPPGVSPSENTVLWVLRKVINLAVPDSLGISHSEPSADQRPRLTNCDCDLSGGNRSRDPCHRTYQEACMQGAKVLVSYFEKLAHGDAEGGQTAAELEAILWCLTRKPLLRHCCLDTELLSLCREFLKLAEKCLSLAVNQQWRENAQKYLFGWLETFPDELAKDREALKAQVLTLPWEQWDQAWCKRYRQQ
ncbi:hypothetical protein PM082_011199 [Marasmius tenuissimus]|nr:hypothetical protein PM082_011199 [Marasmius tenuissimus]